MRKIAAVLRAHAGLLVLPCLAISVSYGQGTTGSLGGSVTDESGAVVQGAAVTVTNAETKAVRENVTNDAGLYSFPFLSIGTYDVSVKAKGFSTFVQTGVEVVGASPATLPIRLKVGQTTQVLEVLSQSPVLQTEDVGNASVVDDHKIHNLPVYGLNPLTIVNLVPGSAVNDVTGVGDAGKVNGSRMGGGIKYLLDGVNISRDYGRSSNGTGVAFNPQLEALGELNVISNNFPAEYGRVQGAVIAMNFKSGTNAYHGEAYEFWRNAALNAKNYFNSGKKPQSFFNQFGATLGGPIVRNRLFFFAAWEERRSLTPQQGQTDNMPTDKMRQGDFSELSIPIYDPTTTQVTAPYGRSAFPGNRIPSTRINPAAAKAVQFYPEPNFPGISANFITNPVSRSQRDSGDIKVDYYLSPKDSFYGRLSVQPTDSGSPFRLYNLVGQPPVATSTATNYGAQGNHTHIFSSAIVNELRFGYFNTNVISAANQQNLTSYLGNAFGIPSNDPAEISYPQLIVNGYDWLGFSTPYARSWQIGYQLDDTVSIVKATHHLKFGLQIRKSDAYDFAMTCPAGCYNFTGAFTNDSVNPLAAGDSLADMLLGMPYSVNQSFVTPIELRSVETGLFVQDTWKATRKLSLSLGVRWDYFGALSEAHGRVSAYDPTTDSLVQKTGGLSTPAKDLFVPRVGLTYLLTPRTVIRTAYGISTFPQLQGIGADLLGIPPFARSQTLQNFGTYYQTLTQPPVTLGQALPALPQKSFPLAASPTINAPLFANYIPTPSWQMWNFTIQREVTNNVSFEIGYVGTRGAHLDSSTLVDANVPPASQYGPDALFGGKTFQQRKPYPDMGSLEPFDNRGDSMYNGLQANVNWRYKHGLTFFSSYAKQKNLTNHPGRCCNAEFRTGAGAVSFQRDISNWGLNWGPDGSTPYNVFVTSFEYELPFGPGKSLLNHGGLIGRAVGGWKLSGIYTYRTGNQFGVVDRSATQMVPNRICNGNLPSSQRTITHFFDTSCFTNPNPIYSLGDAGFGIIEGPSSSDLDSAVFKDFRITERFRLQFRGEFFDVLNTPHFFLGRGMLFGTANFGANTETLDQERGLTGQANRSGQLSLKLLF